MKEISRIVGTYGSKNEGPLLFITAGIHGNEPSGYKALEKVFKILHNDRPAIKGKVVGLAGNIKALQKGVRFIDEDLNRTWTEENIASQEIDSHEKREMFAIIKAFKKYRDKNMTKTYFLDCHTTSADSEPYISVQDVNDNDKWAHFFPTYIIRGFSDIVQGCIDHYESDCGFTGFVFEGGQHESKDAIEHHIGMIWHTIHHACQLNFEDLETYPSEVRKLEAKRAEQKTFAIEYRFGLKDTDDFVMKPGFKNFQPIKKGQRLAHLNGEAVYSEWDDYIFMPLYQSQGNDGFFVVKEVTNHP